MRGLPGDELAGRQVMRVGESDLLLPFHVMGGNNDKALTWLRGLG